MGRKSPEIHPAQGSLLQPLDAGEHRGLQAVEHLPDAVPEPVTVPQIETVYGTPGSYVDVGERAKSLLSSMENVGKANRAAGFAVASNTAQHAGPIYQRYQWRTESVKYGVEQRGKEYADQAKRDFWKSTGNAALKSAGLDDRITEDGINAIGRQDWNRYLDDYAVPSNKHSRNARNRLKRSLSKQIEYTEKIKNQPKKAA